MKTERDKTVKNLLTVAIGLLYPIVVYLLVTLIIPSEKNRSLGYGDYSGSDYVPQAYIALAIALATLFATVYKLRSIKELFMGLLAGSSIVVVIATLTLYGVIGSLDIGTQATANLLLLASGAVQLVALYLAEKNYPEDGKPSA